MTFQEKRSIVYLISTLIVMGMYCAYVFGFNYDRSLNPETDFKFYGITTLLIIPSMIIVHILTLIIFNIYYSISTREKGEMFEDEMDKAIELRSNRNAYNAFLVVFFLSMGSLVLEMSTNVLMNMLIGAMFMGSLTWCISSLYYYRRGF